MLVLECSSFPSDRLQLAEVLLLQTVVVYLPDGHYVTQNGRSCKHIKCSLVKDFVERWRHSVASVKHVNVYMVENNQSYEGDWVKNWQGHSEEHGHKYCDK